MVPYNIDISVSGDIAIAVWFGSYNLGQRIQTQPAPTYCFHTAFVDASVERVTVNQLDVVDGNLFPTQAARNFFIDITLEEVSSEDGTGSEKDDSQLDMPGDVQWMRSKWRDTVTKMYGAEKVTRVVNTVIIPIAMVLGKIFAACIMGVGCGPLIKPSTKRYRRLARLVGCWRVTSWADDENAC